MTATWLGVLLTAHLSVPTPCATLAAHVTDARNEAMQWAGALWPAVADADVRLWARDRPRFAWVDLASASAWYCATVDTVYASQALAEWAWRGRGSDGAELMGFVLAHELSHRRFDDAPAAFASGADSAWREARADRRATFVLALTKNPFAAGHLSAFALDRHGGLERFLEDELAWSPASPAYIDRLSALREGLGRMRDFGARYLTALVATLARRDDAVVGWLDELDRYATVDDHAALPELDLLRATVHLDRAARVGWCNSELAAAPLDPSPCTLRCVPTVAGEPLLSTRDLLPQRARPLIDRDAELAAGRRALLRASATGLARNAVDGVGACLAYVGARPDEALGLAVDGAQRSLARLQRLVVESSAPIASAEWLDEVREAVDDVADGEAGRAMHAWLEPTTLLRQRGPAPDVALDAWVTTPTTLSERLAINELRPTLLSSRLSAWLDRCDALVQGHLDDGRDAYTVHCDTWDTRDERWVLFVRDDSIERVFHVGATR